MNEQRLMNLSTAALGAVVLLGAFSTVGRALVAILSVVMFLGGGLAMAVALVRAAQRSRESVINVSEVFFSVPKPLLFGLGAQVAFGIVSASLHPNTGAAFGILAPVAGLGVCGLWGARHGTYPARET